MVNMDLFSDCENRESRKSHLTTLLYEMPSNSKGKNFV